MKHQTNLLRFGVPIFIGVVILAIALLAAGRDGTAGDDQGQSEDPGHAYQVEQVTIDSVSVRIAESFPVQGFVDVTGTLPDPCWEPQEPSIKQDGPRWEIEIVAERPEDTVCAQVIEPYQESIPLGQLEPGDYAVEVNGVEQRFSVD